MPAEDAQPLLPVKFHFLVEFQSKLDRFKVSFVEVSGLDIQLKTEDHPNDTGVWIKMPRQATYGNITLKRPVAALKTDPFSQWVNKILTTDNDKRIVPYDAIVKLLDSNRNPLAGWQCVRTYPIQWTLDGLDAARNELAIETIVLACNRITRIV